MKVPIYIVEEHNEVFTIWNLARKREVIGLDNILLHIDDHSDLRAPILNMSVSEVFNMDVAEISKFSERELTIDTFIIPAIYQGLIKKLIWIKRDMNKFSEFEMFIRSYNEDGRKFISDKSLFQKDHQNLRKFSYVKTNVQDLVQTRTDMQGDVLLDFDLDYFSCCENPDREVIIEISEKEYIEFNANKYHTLKFMLSKVEAIKYGESFYYVFNRNENLYPSNRKLEIDEIYFQVDLLMDSLLANCIIPRLITICRSRYSGFTPNDQWQTIENYLLKKLRGLYDIDSLSAIHIPETVNNNY